MYSNDKKNKVNIKTISYRERLKLWNINTEKVSLKEHSKIIIIIFFLRFLGFYSYLFVKELELKLVELIDAMYYTQQHFFESPNIKDIIIIFLSLLYYFVIVSCWLIFVVIRFFKIIQYFIGLIIHTVICIFFFNMVDILWYWYVKLCIPLQIPFDFWWNLNKLALYFIILVFLTLFIIIRPWFRRFILFYLKHSDYQYTRPRAWLHRRYSNVKLEQTEKLLKSMYITILAIFIMSLFMFFALYMLIIDDIFDLLANSDFWDRIADVNASDIENFKDLAEKERLKQFDEFEKMLKEFKEEYEKFKNSKKK